MSCGGFTIPGMPSCGCGGSGGSCSCGSKRQAPLNAPAVGAIPGYSPAGGGAQAYGGPAGGGSCACGSGGTQAGEHQSSGGASLSLSVPARIPGFPSWAVSSTRRCGGTCDNCKKRSHGAQPKHQGPTKPAVVSRGHTSGATPSGFRENGGSSKIGVGIPTAGHRNLPERSLSPLRGVSARNNTHEGVPVGINDPPPSSPPGVPAWWKLGPCPGSWRQIPGTNIWFCESTQEWFDFDTGRHGYGLGTIDSGYSTSESPRQKSCKVQLWKKNINGVRAVCHLWIEIYHCNGAWDRWELWDTPNTNVPSLGNIEQRSYGRGESEEGSDPQMVEEEVIACTPEDPLRCKCINRELMLSYPLRTIYDSTGPNSNTFAIWVLKSCKFNKLVDARPFCAWGSNYTEVIRAPIPSTLQEVWVTPGALLYPRGPRW